VGVFTSPHLVRVTERFRVLGKPCDDEVFITSFWEVWDALHAGYESEINDTNQHEVPEAVPGYFRLLTLVSMWLFAKQHVKVS
jgi:folylpolyglutamate synthase/dihydropteroate synthase